MLVSGSRIEACYCFVDCGRQGNRYALNSDPLPWAVSAQPDPVLVSHSRERDIRNAGVGKRTREGRGRNCRPSSFPHLPRFQLLRSRSSEEFTKVVATTDAFPMRRGRVVRNRKGEAGYDAADLGMNA